MDSRKSYNNNAEHLEASFTFQPRNKRKNGNTRPEGSGDVAGKGLDAAALVEEAQALITKHTPGL